LAPEVTKNKNNKKDSLKFLGTVFTTLYLFRNFFNWPNKLKCYIKAGKACQR
jgi:hypothetical protein